MLGLMFRALIWLMAFASTSASASIVMGHLQGRWRVSSVSSVSGDGGVSGDAAVAVYQGDDDDRIDISWDEHRPVHVSLRIHRCQKADDFSKGYEIPAAQWLHVGAAGMSNQLEQDFSAWLEEARKMCKSPRVANRFRMSHLDRAVNDFTQLLRYYAVPTP